MPSKKYKADLKNRERMRLKRASAACSTGNDSAEQASTTTTAEKANSTSDAAHYPSSSSASIVTETSVLETSTSSAIPPKCLRRTHSKIIEDAQKTAELASATSNSAAEASTTISTVENYQTGSAEKASTSNSTVVDGSAASLSPLTPVSKRPRDSIFNFPSACNDEHDSDDDSVSLELPVAADNIAVLPHGHQQQTATTEQEILNKRGHPFRTPSHNPRGRKSDDRRSSDKRTPLLATANTSNLRLLPKLKSRHVELIEQRMRDLKSNYNCRKWLPKSDNSRSKKNTVCPANCSCAKCYLDAEAYIKASDYIAQHREDDDHFVQEKMGKLACAPTGRCHLSTAEKANSTFGCAAASLNHQVPYYDSGTFGDRICPFCGALMLDSEYQQYKRGRKTICCSNGECCTGPLWKGWKERQDPPKQLLDLINEPDKKKRDEFLNNTMPLNNTFAFASTHSEKAPADQMGGRMDTCKYNGEFSFLFSDLIAPEGKRPTFAQVYTLTPEEARKLRPEHFTHALHKTVRQEIFDKLEELLRQSPLGRSFTTLADKVKTAELAQKQTPRFQIVLLTDRELKEEAIRNRTDCTVVDIERADAPSSEQVAVIWVQEDGLAPLISGFWIQDKAGKMRELHNGRPELDPACFPVLHPRGSSGWKWSLKKRPIEKQVNEMEEQLARARDLELQPSADPATSSDLVQAMANVSPMDNYEIEYENDELDVDLAPDTQITAEEATPTAEVAEIDIFNDDDNVVIPKFDPVDSKKTTFVKKEGPQENISQRRFYRFQMALRNNDKNAFHWLWFSRRLAEFFVISVLNRIERNEMDMLKKQQERINLREVIAKDYIDALAKGLQKEGKKLGRVFMMPSYFAGSRQYYQKAYADLMTIVRRMGNPTWFVTFTGNPHWPEIASALQQGQSYEHRADIVCRIFMDKATEFIADLTKRHVLGRVAAWCYSVEHQKRGMPHIHALLILHKDATIESPSQVDEYVCARIPTLPRIEDESVAAKQQRRLWHLVTGNMLHDCNNACLIDGECDKHFPKPFTPNTTLSAVRYTEYTRIPPTAEVATNNNAPSSKHNLTVDNDEERSVHYKRLKPGRKSVPEFTFENNGLIFKKQRQNNFMQIDDSRVIPYNTFLLLKYSCHINIEYVFGQKACKYIFKYIIKGFEKAYVRVTRPGANENEYDYDEIAATFKVRYMTSMEAYLRLSSYKIVNMSHNIYTMSLHEENGQTIVVEEGHEEENRSTDKIFKDTQLTAFFRLCKENEFARTLRYDELPYHFWWNKNKREWLRRVYPLKSDYGEATMFVRLYTASPKRRELFALRALLLCRNGITSFEDLRTIPGQRTYATFSEAAKALGLLESDDLYRKAMSDANAEKSNLKQLIHYFAMLIFHCNPSDPQKLFNEFLDDMYPPPAANDENAEPISMERRKQKVMCTLEYFFRCLDTTTSKMGLSGLPATYNHETVSAEIEGEGLLDDFYGGTNRKKSFREVALAHLKKLNEEQRNAFDQIVSALNSEDPTTKRLFFLEGAGGCGKTYLYNTLIRWCLAGKPSIATAGLAKPKTLHRNSVVACATTGIAALLLIGGGTVHRQFRITNDVDKNTPPRISAESMDAERLRNAELIIIDEVSLMHRDIFNYLDRLLRDVCSSSIPFGGKTMLFGGDWKQLTPVVPRGNRQDQVEASLKSDPLFTSEFTTLRLKKNMRAAADQKKLCEWLLELGNDTAELANNGLLKIPDECLSYSIDEILEFCFPSDVLKDPMQYVDVICDRALLCPRNTDVENLNTLAMKRLHGTEMQYLSTDSPLDCADPLDYMSIYRSDFNLESVHNETPTGFPPHELTLKIGAPVMLIRNLDVSQGLCNGTRLQVEKMTPHNLYCRILTGPRADAKSTVILPRIMFEYGKQPGERGVRFQRLQFPVRPCFAMTVNKAQGQTLKRMGLVLSSHQCFSHGQVYVAMSRVTELAGIRVFSPNSTVPNHISNIVYQELLDGRRPPTNANTSVSVTPPIVYDPLPDEFVFET